MVRPQVHPKALPAVAPEPTGPLLLHHFLQFARHLCLPFLLHQCRDHVRCLWGNCHLASCVSDIDEGPVSADFTAVGGGGGSSAAAGGGGISGGGVSGGEGGGGLLAKSDRATLLAVNSASERWKGRTQLLSLAPKWTDESRLLSSPLIGHAAAGASASFTLVSISARNGMGCSTAPSAVALRWSTLAGKIGWFQSRWWPCDRVDKGGKSSQHRKVSGGNMEKGASVQYSASTLSLSAYTP